MPIEIKIKKLHPDVETPKYATEGASGIDLISYEDYYLKTKEIKLVQTGLSVEIPLGYEMQIRPRSGLALKKGIIILNTPGTVDSDYRGEIGVILINHSNENHFIAKGDRIAQAVINKIERAILIEVDRLSDSHRGSGGFGSTGA
jgi:dUTP pyrophosphatase